MINCETKCWKKQLTGGMNERIYCEKVQECVCTVCGTLKAININLYDACASACNTNVTTKRPKDLNAFYATLDAEDVYNRYKLKINGFDPTTTTEYQEAQKETINNEIKAQQTKKDNTKTITYAIVVAIVLVLIVVIYKMFF